MAEKSSRKMQHSGIEAGARRGGFPSWSRIPKSRLGREGNKPLKRNVQPIGPKTKAMRGASRPAAANKTVRDRGPDEEQGTMTNVLEANGNLIADVAYVKLQNGVEMVRIDGQWRVVEAQGTAG